MPKRSVTTRIPAMTKTFEQNIIKMMPVFVALGMAIKKSEAALFIQNFQNGIRDNNFMLEALKQKTVDAKKAKGYSRPNAPLYARGDERKDDSYMNMLRIRSFRKGWKVFPSWKVHWSGAMKLRDMLDVHEHGAVIKKKSGKAFRIVPRPAFLKARLRTLRQLKKRTSNKLVIRAINRAMKTGRMDSMKKIQIKFEKQSKGLIIE